MACQAVRQVGNLIFGLLQMAIQTPAHVHLHYWSCDRHATDVTMASFAIDACPQVGLMTEVDEVGLLIYAVPRNWLAAFPITRQSLNCLDVGGDDGMAAHAFLHGGYASHIRAQRAGMAEQTLQTGLNVNSVAVGDWLLWSGKDLSACENHTHN
jgi:hypothetical protein